MAILARCNLVVQDTAGNIINGASIRVEKEETGFPLASLFSDRAGAVPILNPFTAADGSDAGFHVIGGRYKITATLGGFTKTWRYVAIGTAQEFDADLLKAGALLIWDTGTSDANPGAGRARANNASLAAGNTLFISKTNRGGSSIANFLLQLDDSTNTDKGGLVLTDPTTDKQALMRVTAIVDAVNYVKVSYTGHSGETAFANDLPINLHFARSGDAVTAAGSVTYNGSTVQAALDQRPGRNHLMNGAFQVAQRGTSFTSAGGGNNNDVYTLDRWNLLSVTNNTVDVTQEASDVPTNGLFALKMAVVTVNQKFGISQIIEAKDSIGLIGQQVTFSFKAKVNNVTRMDKIKAAIIAWSGTADVITSNFISGYNSDGTNPTLIANATYENAPVDLNVTTAWQSFSVSALIDTASTKNVIVYIWSDNSIDTDAGDFLSIADVQLEIGPIPTPFERVLQAIDEMRCRRYFRRVAEGNGTAIANGFAFGTTGFSFMLRYERMRVAPALVVSSQSHFAAHGAGLSINASITFGAITASPEAMRIDGTVASGLTSGGGTQIFTNNAAALMDLNAEL